MANVVTDPFTAPNGTDLQGRVPPVAPGGSSWSERVGNWSITSDRASGAQSQRAHATIDAGEADVVVQAKLTNNSGIGGHNQISGVVARWTATTDFWCAGYSQFEDVFYLLERNANVYVQRSSASVPIDNAQHVVAITANGTQIEAKLDGGNTLTYGSASHNQTATQHGIMARNNTDTADDFAVDTVAVAPIEVSLTPQVVPVDLVSPTITVGLVVALSPLTVPIVLVGPAISVGGGQQSDAVDQRYYRYVADDGSIWGVKVDRTWGEDPDSGADDWVPGTPVMTKRSNVQARRIVLQDPISGRYTTRVVFTNTAVAWVTPGYTTQIPIRGASGLVTVQLIERRPEWIPRPRAIHHKPEPTTV